MRDIEKNVSLFVENLFPAVYREDAPFFINFVKAYYEWMESQNELLFHARRLTEYRDIDQVPDAFILFFKNKYLPDIQFTTATNKQLFIKNALDFYRSKGTPRSVDLYFKLVHGLEAQVYNPGQDLFRLSDNEYTKITYLEIIPVPNIEKVVGRTIYGSITLSEAFVDRIVRVKKDSRIMTVLYIENVIGAFATGERFTTNDDTDLNVGSTICGSLSEVEIVSSDANFEIGERLYIVPTASDFGKQAVLQVSDTTSYEGVVNFELLNPGYGYTLDILDGNGNVILPGAEVLGSERVLFIDNIEFTNNEYLHVNDYLNRFDLVTQPLVKFTYNNASADDDFATKRIVKAYYPDVQISLISIDGSQVVQVDTVTGHNLTTGDYISIVGTNNYDGDYGPITTIDGNTFTYSDSSGNTSWLDETSTGNVSSVAFEGTVGVLEVSETTGTANVVVSYDTDLYSITNLEEMYSFDIASISVTNASEFEITVVASQTIADNALNWDLKTGDYITITGTNQYDGKFGPITVGSGTTIIYNDASANTSAAAETTIVGGLKWGRLYTASNTDTGTLTLVSDVSASANVIAVSQNCTISYTTSGSNLQVGDKITQKHVFFTSSEWGSQGFAVEHANAVVTNTSIDTSTVPATYYADITLDTGAFRNDTVTPLNTFDRVSDGQSFTLINISNTQAGVISVEQSFTTGNAYAQFSGAKFKIDQSTTYETPASFKISGLNEEVIIPDAWCEDLIQSVGMTTLIGSSSYTGVPQGINSTLAEVFNFYDITVGSIEEIITTSPGRNYASDPFFVVFETKVDHWSLEKYDYFVHYQKSSGESGYLNFQIGEAIVGQTSGTRGRIYAHDEDDQRLSVTRLNPYTDFLNEEIITAETTNISAKITLVYENRRNMEHQLGLNANVSSDAFSGEGFVTDISVINSGFGYENNTDVTLASFDDFEKRIQAKIYFGVQGKAEGYFYNRKSFLSSDKYLQDSDFWQEYSYQVKTEMPYANYEDVFKKVLHPAGTKSFGSYFATQKAQVGITSKVETAEFGLKIDQNLLNLSQFFSPNVKFIVQAGLFDHSNSSEFEIAGEQSVIRLKQLIQNNTFFDADDLVTYTHSIQHV